MSSSAIKTAWIAWPLKVALIGCPETSVNKQATISARITSGKSEVTYNWCFREGRIACDVTFPKWLFVQRMVLETNHRYRCGQRYLFKIRVDVGDV